MEREVRYCTTEDGVRIAYASIGSGPALIMLGDSPAQFSMPFLAASTLALRAAMRSTGLAGCWARPLDLLAAELGLNDLHQDLPVAVAVGHERKTTYTGA